MGPEITKYVSFFADDEPPGPKVLSIDTDGAIVHITVGEADDQRRQVTEIAVHGDDETRGGDGEGRVWKPADVNAGGIRLVRYSKTASRRFLADQARAMRMSSGTATLGDAG